MRIIQMVGMSDGIIMPTLQYSPDTPDLRAFHPDVEKIEQRRLVNVDEPFPLHTAAQ